MVVAKARPLSGQTNRQAGDIDEVLARRINLKVKIIF